MSAMCVCVCVALQHVRLRAWSPLVIYRKAVVCLAQDFNPWGNVARIRLFHICILSLQHFASFEAVFQGNSTHLSALLEIKCEEARLQIPFMEQMQIISLLMKTPIFLTAYFTYLHHFEARGIVVQCFNQTKSLTFWLCSVENNVT